MMDDEVVQTVRVGKQIVHENYKRSSNSSLPINDIALIMVDKQLTFNNRVQPAKLPKEKLEHTGEVDMVGWGNILEDMCEKVPPIMQTASVSILDNKSCQFLLSGFGSGETLYNSHICTNTAGKPITACPVKHPPRLIDEDVEKYICPVYEELSKYELLARCLGGHTENANESFNSTVWHMTPKHLYSSIKVVEIAVYVAVGMFNEDYSAALKTMQLLDLKIGQQCHNFAERADKERVTQENRRASFSSKEARTALRLEHLGENQFFEESEGQLYGPGIAD